MNLMPLKDQIQESLECVIFLLEKLKFLLGEYKVKIFDRERCIVDAFRYLSKEIAIKAIQRYFQSTTYKPDPKKLGAYAKKLRVNITPYILSYTT